MSFIAILLAFSLTDPPPGSRYDDCIALLEADLEIGRIAAQQWVSEGGGADARHCLAIADLKSGFPKLAATRLQEIAQRKDAGDDYIRARVLIQAAEAWLEADQFDKAEQALLEAKTMVPDSGELQLTATKIYAALERWQDTLDAANLAEEAGFISAPTFLYRARAYIYFGHYEAAAKDVVNALSIEPMNVDALVLRGELQQLGIVIDVYYDESEKN